MISVITPSFNQANYIERTIQSILSQNVPMEYVVIDGGSTDATTPILEKYAAQLRFISEKDRGQAHAVNKGLRMTSGEIIGWLNSDDVYYPGTLKKVLEFFAAHPDVDVVYGKAHHIDANDNVIELYPTETWNLENFRKNCFLSQPAVFFRRQVVEQFGYLNENLNFCLDYEFWLRLAIGGAKFVYLPELLAGSRLHPETKTVSSPFKAQQEALFMLQRQLGFVPENWLIKDAIAYVKSNTSLSMPDVRYVIFVFVAAIFSAFRWNGFWKGMCSCFALPKAMLLFKKTITS